MERKLTARATTEIQAPLSRVWNALVNPEIIRKYMFGTHVISDWKVGSQIIWKGEWNGKSYTDKGEILQMTEGKLLQYSHFSPLSGIPETRENFHVVTIQLKDKNNKVEVELSQDNNETEESRDHSQKNWEAMLKNLKEILETGKENLSN
jgi:uncharacterized protein YndB with AHSA1/START domain